MTAKKSPKTSLSDRLRQVMEEIGKTLSPERPVPVTIPLPPEQRPRPKQ